MWKSAFAAKLSVLSRTTKKLYSSYCLVRAKLASENFPCAVEFIASFFRQSYWFIWRTCDSFTMPQCRSLARVLLDACKKAGRSLYMYAKVNMILHRAQTYPPRCSFPKNRWLIFTLSLRVPELQPNSGKSPCFVMSQQCTRFGVGTVSVFMGDFPNLGLITGIL